MMMDLGLQNDKLTVNVDKMRLTIDVLSASIWLLLSLIMIITKIVSHHNENQNMGQWY